MAEAENGKTDQELVAYLQKRGWAPAAARRFVTNALHVNAAEPAVLGKAQPAQHGAKPSLLSVVTWLSALSALLWVLVDVASRISS